MSKVGSLLYSPQTLYVTRDGPEIFTHSNDTKQYFVLFFQVSVLVLIWSWNLSSLVIKYNSFCPKVSARRCLFWYYCLAEVLQIVAGPRSPPPNPWVSRFPVATACTVWACYRRPSFLDIFCPKKAHALPDIADCRSVHFPSRIITKCSALVDLQHIL